MKTHYLKIKGTVQGVGFRPFIYTLAIKHSLKGTVSNSSNGVEIFINSSNLDSFISDINSYLPPLASITSFDIEEVKYIEFSDFRIIKTSNEGEIGVNIPPDVSICKECEKELFDPNNRRYGYPFITCTNCGVRYSIIHTLPYDRGNTSMRDFEMCKACDEEYHNPLDRRYHAQPIGCFDCGTQLSLLSALGEVLTPCIASIVKLIVEGNILAIKGVGGYHLICDATNKEAIATLRKRKYRPTKPFAVMVRDIEMAREFSYLSTKEEGLLESKEKPIVLVEGRDTGLPLAVITPNISHIGLFLPYTPLHLLILKSLNRPIVATSANVSDEPICTTLEALKKLHGVYDYVLEHNRDIVNGCDDSVVMVVKGQQVILRRARGYAPMSIQLPFTLQHSVLALGANQKSTIAIGFDNQVILSPHIGDLNSIGSVEYYKKNIQTLERMYHFNADVIAHDMHPQYESSKYAKAFVATHTVKEVQHHYAHILAVMAEKQLKTKVFGVAFDGTGYGDDGRLWGGEFMLCDYKGYERVAHIQYFKLLGGAKAIKEPKRVALSLLFDLYGQKVLTLDNPTTQAFSPTELKSYFITWQKGVNAPESSSIGRLFDAVASLLGVCQVMHFEGESGMMLEALYDSSVEGYYRFGYANKKIDILPILDKIVSENNRTIAVSRFFHTLVEIIAVVYAPYTLPLVLSGGVFQNRVLLGLVLERFPKAVIASTIPPNDGGIALGQVVSQIL